MYRYCFLSVCQGAMGRPIQKPANELPPGTQRLAEAIGDLGMSRKDFAERLGMSPSGFRSIFQKGTAISPVLAKGVECEFQINHRWLLEGEEPKYVQRFSRLYPSECWLLEFASPLDYPSPATMVDIPLTLAVLFFQRNLIRLMGQLSARRLQNHEVMDEVTNWHNHYIQQRLKRDWEELKQALPVKSTSAELILGIDRDRVPEDQLKQWQTAMYYFMDLVVVDDELRPSSEAEVLGIEIDQNWIGKHRNDFLAEWQQLFEKVSTILDRSEDGLIRGD